MSTSVEYQSVFPIGNTDPMNLPVPDVERAVRFYARTLGFRLDSRGEEPVPHAVMSRDGVTLRFAKNGGDPEQASCYLAVSNVDAAREELSSRGADVSPIRTDAHGGQSYRVFFVRDDQGLCYCLGAPVGGSAGPP